MLATPLRCPLCSESSHRSHVELYEKTPRNGVVEKPAKRAILGGDTLSGSKRERYFDEARCSLSSGLDHSSLLGKINGHIRTETSQHGGIKEIDSVKALQARTRWRGFSSIGQRHNECHLLNVLSHRKPGRAAALFVKREPLPSSGHVDQMACTADHHRA